MFSHFQKVAIISNTDPQQHPFKDVCVTAMAESVFAIKSKIKPSKTCMVIKDTINWTK